MQSPFQAELVPITHRVHRWPDIPWLIHPTCAEEGDVTTGRQAFFIHFGSVQSLGRVRLFATPWTEARQTSLSISNSRSLLKLMPIESVMPSSHLILCRPLLLLPSVFPSIWVFSNESALHMRWPKYWSFSFSISPSNKHSALISFRMDFYMFAWRQMDPPSITLIVCVLNFILKELHWHIPRPDHVCSASDS